MRNALTQQLKNTKHYNLLLLNLFLISCVFVFFFKPSKCDASSNELKSFSADIQSSTWNTQYRTAGGQLVNAQVSFQGNRGTYKIFGNNGNVIGTGNLSNIRFEIPNTKSWLAVGTWSLNGSSGYFDFRSESDTSQFKGNWGFGNNGTKKGFWNGRRLMVEPPQMGANKGNGNVNQDLGRQFYTSWKWQANQKRYFALYCFKKRRTDANYTVQWIFHYPYDNERRLYIYYFNVQK